MSSNQNIDNQVIKNKKDNFSYIEFIKRLEIAEKEKEQKMENGLFFDKEDIPQYLSADDHYNGIENPEWTKKYAKKELKPTTNKNSENNKKEQHEKLGFNYDEDGIPEYLNANDRYYGDANPEWLKKHEKSYRFYKIPAKRLSISVILLI